MTSEVSHGVRAHSEGDRPPASHAITFSLPTFELFLLLLLSHGAFSKGQTEKTQHLFQNLG